METKERKNQMKRWKAIKKRLSKVAVGLPKKVTFEYDKGTVVCYPKKRTWLVMPLGKKSVIHIISKDHRNDVTKYKARYLLKFALINMLRDDSPLKPKKNNYGRK